MAKVVFVLLRREYVVLSGFRHNFLLNSLEKVGDHLRKRLIVMHLIFFFFNEGWK